MKSFCFTVDDNIRFLKELTAESRGSLFEHPYLNMYKRLHEKYGLKIQLNMFCESEDFDLSAASAQYLNEWRACSDWLKLSFHSRLENTEPYIRSGYDEVLRDCQHANSEIVRFASPSALAKTTTVHYCQATDEGLRALKDLGIRGLLGLYGTTDSPCTSYRSTAEECAAIREGATVLQNGIFYAGIDIVLNTCTKNEILARLKELTHRDLVKIMIHEQYFYADYPYYQKDFEEKLTAAFDMLTKSGFASSFFEECLP